MELILLFSSIASTLFQTRIHNFSSQYCSHYYNRSIYNGLIYYEHFSSCQPYLLNLITFAGIKVSLSEVRLSVGPPIGLGYHSPHIQALGPPIGLGYPSHPLTGHWARVNSPARDHKPKADNKKVSGKNVHRYVKTLWLIEFP